MKKRAWSAAFLAATLSFGVSAYAQQGGNAQRDETEPALQRTGQQSTTDQQSSERRQQPPSARSGEQARSAGEEGAEGGSLSSMDREFLTKAAQGSLAEVQMGTLAQERGSSGDVKDIGEMLQEDHSKSYEQVQKIASKKQATLPSEPNAEQKAAMERMAKLSGQEFDREFLRHQEASHKKNIEAFERAEQQSKDSAVQQFASETLPVLQKHLEHVQQAMGSGAQGQSARPASPSDR